MPTVAKELLHTTNIMEDRLVWPQLWWCIVTITSRYVVRVEDSAANKAMQTTHKLLSSQWSELET